MHCCRDAASERGPQFIEQGDTAELWIVAQEREVVPEGGFDWRGKQHFGRSRNALPNRA